MLGETWRAKRGEPVRTKKFVVIQGLGFHFVRTSRASRPLSCTNSLRSCSHRFAEWNKGELKSYLIEITSDILKKKDDKKAEGYVIDKIKDCTGMKGTGMWTVKEAAEQAVPAPTIAAALDARFLSGRKEEREVASTILKGPTEVPSVSHEQILEDLQSALYAAKICSYAQGLCLIKVSASERAASAWGGEDCNCNCNSSSSNTPQPFS